jgi:hypothetical protein
MIDKRSLTRQYKETPPPMGVYVIRNLATGRVRVRASMNLEGAINRDRFELGLKSHLLEPWREELECGDEARPAQ